MAVFVMLGLDIYLRMRPIGLPTSFGGEGEAMEKYQDYRELPFVLLGDSITQVCNCTFKLMNAIKTCTQFGTSPTGWTSRMTCSYVLRLDVLNRGHSGATTNDYVKDAKRIVDAVGKRPNLVTIMLGTK